MRQLLRYALQPALLTSSVVLWNAWPTSETVLPITLLASLLLLMILESRWPARPEWSVEWRERATQIAAYLVLGGGLTMLAELYPYFLAEPLLELRTSWNVDVWPHEWPGVVQLFLVFFASDFILYWIHRAMHRWAVVWRLTGHGPHHAFKKLGALNSGLNHPLELAWLALPVAAIELVFGIGAPAAGAAVLVGVQAAIAHTNLDLNSAVIGWLFTTNRHHIHHHSVIIDESNTNYGCSAILWDRLFGTFADAPTAETGTGPTEPGWMGKFLMPFVEPSDTEAAPRRATPA